MSNVIKVDFGYRKPSTTKRRYDAFLTAALNDPGDGREVYQAALKARHPIMEALYAAAEAGDCEQEARLWETLSEHERMLVAVFDIQMRKIDPRWKLDTRKR